MLMTIRVVRTIVLATVVLTLQAACAHSPRLDRPGQAPDPRGCFVYIYQLDEFGGERRLINGPAQISDTSYLVGQWAQGVSSLRVGDAATVEVHSRTDFFGRSLGLASGTSVPLLQAFFRDPIMSLLVECDRR